MKLVHVDMAVREYLLYCLLHLLWQEGQQLVVPEGLRVAELNDADWDDRGQRLAGAPFQSYTGTRVPGRSNTPHPQHMPTSTPRVRSRQDDARMEESVNVPVQRMSALFANSTGAAMPTIAPRMGAMVTGV